MGIGTRSTEILEPSDDDVPRARVLSWPIEVELDSALQIQNMEGSGLAPGVSWDTYFNAGPFEVFVVLGIGQHDAGTT